MKNILLGMTILLFCTGGVFAETPSLKEDTIMHGMVMREDEATVIIASGESWRKIEKSTIELITQDEPRAAPRTPAALLEDTPSTAAEPVAPQAPALRERKQSGMYLGFQVPYNMIGGDFDGTHAPDLDAGIGLGLILGYRFDPQFGLQLDWAGSGHNSEGADIGFGEFSLNLKVSFPPESEVRWFLFAGVGAFALGDNSLTFGGTGYNLGVGLDYQVAEQNTLGLAVIRKFITYDTIEKSDAPLVLVGELNGDATSIRLDVTHQF